MKDIKDYIGKEYAILCTTQEEFSRIKELLKYPYDLKIKEQGELVLYTKETGWDPKRYCDLPMIEASEFMQLKFEVGKWYCLPDCSDYKGKYLREDWVSEYIDDRRSYWKSEGKASFKDAIELSKEDLIKYLPKDHPDYPKNEFIVGAWYRNPADSMKNTVFAKFLKWENNHWYYSERIDIEKFDIGTKYTTSKGGNWCYSIKSPVYEPIEYSEINKIVTELTTKTNNQNDTSKTESCKVQRPNLSISTAIAGGGERFTSTKSKIRFGNHDCDYQKRSS